MPKSSERRPAGTRALTLVAAAIAAIALLAPATAAAHPDHLVEPIEVGDLGYSPATVTIRQGSSVQWRWENSIAHSVTSAPGSSLQFDSGVHANGDSSFVLRFDEPGTFNYFSKGGSRIEGTISVVPLPGRTPAITDLRVRGRSKPTARFRVNKGVFLVGRIQERKSGGWRTRKSLSESAGKGSNRFRLPVAGLDRGRYRLKLTAYDRYRREDTARVRFRLR